jgi:hypothetical protein
MPCQGPLGQGGLSWKAPTLRRAVFGVLLVAAIASAVGGRRALAQEPAQPLVLRAGMNFQQLGSFRVRRDPTYRGAIRAFGPASRCRLVTGPTFVEAHWQPLGLTLLLATYGGMPEGETGCTRPDLIHISSIHVMGAQWRTGAGLKIGDSGVRIPRLYPRALFIRRQRAWWLVPVRERCIVCASNQKFHTVTRLKAKMQKGRVAAFIFPVGAQGE